MSMNVNRGGINTSTTPNNQTQVRAVDPKVYFLEAETAPLTALMEKTKGEPTTNYKYEWIEKELGTPIGSLNGAINGAVTSVVLQAGEGAMFSINDLLWIPSTGEQMRITAVTGDTLTVVRGWGEVAAVGALDDAMVIMIGPAFPEAVLSGEAIGMKPIIQFNYTQIFRHFAECSRTEAQTQSYDLKNPKMIERRHESMLIHMEARERAYLFGQRYLGFDAGGKPIHSGRGLDTWIVSNRHNATATFNKQKFDIFLEAIFRYGGKRKIGFCSSGIIDAIHQTVLDNSNFLITDKTAEWGIDVLRYKSPYGMVDLYYHRLISQVMPGYGYFVDMDCIKRKWLQKTIVKPNIQAPDYDGYKDEILTEDHIQFSNEQRSGVIYNP